MIASTSPGGSGLELRLAPHCQYCGRRLEESGYHFMCHVCGANYCYIHMRRHGWGTSTDAADDFSDMNSNPGTRLAPFLRSFTRRPGEEIQSKAKIRDLPRLEALRRTWYMVLLSVRAVLRRPDSQRRTMNQTPNFPSIGLTHWPLFGFLFAPPPALTTT